MSLDGWNYRFDIIDLTSRAGMLQYKGQRFKLPIILDPVDVEGRMKVISLDEKWDDVSIQMVEADRPIQVPTMLRQAMQGALRDMRASSLFPVVSTTRHGLMGEYGGDRSEMPVHVLPHFNLVANDPVKLVRALVRNTIDDPLHDPLFIPGIIDGSNLELLFYLGIEIMDTIKFKMDGLNGLYHTDIGPVHLTDLDRFGGVKKLCSCDHCRKIVTDPSSQNRFHLIADHNVEMLSRRLLQAVIALNKGCLRDLVMGKLAGNPAWISALRSIERKPEPEIFRLAPTHRRIEDQFVTYRDDLTAPDFSFWTERIIHDHSPIPGRSTLLLLPCSARKPYSISRTHQRIRDALKSIKGWKGRVQQVVITSPLGAVPMELEDLYPASYYDIPVTGEWFPEELERTRKVVASIFDKGDFQNVICFHREGSEFFPVDVARSLFGDTRFIDVHSEAKEKEIDPEIHLARVLSEVLGPGRGGNHEKEELLAQVRFSLGYDLSSFQGLEVKWSRRGRELRKDRRPIIVFKKGGPVPTEEGGRILWELNGKDDKKVKIDDFKPKGTVFTQGILSFEGKIRPGDIVLVGTGSEYRGVGRALIHGELMVKNVPGPGVRMIHTAK